MSKKKSKFKDRYCGSAWCTRKGWHSHTSRFPKPDGNVSIWRNNNIKKPVGELRNV